MSRPSFMGPKDNSAGESHSIGDWVPPELYFHAVARITLGCVSSRVAIASSAPASNYVDSTRTLNGSALAMLRDELIILALRDTGMVETSMMTFLSSDMITPIAQGFQANRHRQGCPYDTSNT